MSLREYNSKRDFESTPEPEGLPDKSGRSRFVVSRHQARRLHYDFRLEMGGVLKSWAVPKGPSMNSAEKRFAVMTEDHPVSYLNFKGVIPEGHYGAGVMEIWDKGNFIAVDELMNPINDRAAAAALKKGELKIILKGTHIQGGYVLIRLKADDRNWLLIKHNDEYNIRKPYDAEKHVPVSRKKGSAKPVKENAAKKTVTKKRVVTTGVAKKIAAKKNAVRKSALKESAVKKSAVKKIAVKKIAVKKSAVKRVQ